MDSYKAKSFLAGFTGIALALTSAYSLVKASGELAAERGLTMEDLIPITVQQPLPDGDIEGSISGAVGFVGSVGSKILDHPSLDAYDSIDAKFSCDVDVLSQNIGPDGYPVIPADIGNAGSNPSMDPSSGKGSGAGTAYGSITVIGADYIKAEPSDLIFYDSSDGVSGQAITPWNIMNGRGTGDVWLVKILASDFVDGDKRIPISNLEMLVPNIDRLTGSEAPTTMIEKWTPLSEEGTMIAYSDKGQGMGAYTINPQFRLSIPDGTIGGEYRCKITLAIENFNSN